MDSTIIETQDLTKVYGKGSIAVHALRGVDVFVEKGEFVAVMGPSGSGKSTLMNILGCLDRPSDGAYVLDGEDVSKLNRDRLAQVRNRKIGFVFQSYNLLPRQNALKNVMLPMLYDGHDGLTESNMRERAAEMLELVGLSDRMSHLPKEMSGGQQQRVAVARALVNDPAIILADEPTGNLDTQSAEGLIEVFHALHERGATIVMVTHELGIAGHAQRVIYLRDGKVISDREHARGIADLHNGDNGHQDDGTGHGDQIGVDLRAGKGHQATERPADGRHWSEVADR
ncbi:MAG: ABC transporter ATP-binding protein [Anaerolineae bacterium]|nr:ABC transporter ATP-binding protein [Anaerolineae bacterium]